MNKPSASFLKTSGGIVGLIVVLAILIAVNVILGAMRLRVDLTEENLYTLSEGTRNILKNLDQPVTLKFYFNSSAPEVPVYLKNYAKQVRDLLAEYKMVSRGKITVVKYDPEPDSDAEESAQRHGISGQRMGMFGPPIYFGLAAISGESEGALPVLDPRAEDMLEYNITRLIYRVANPQKPVVGVMSTMPVLGSQKPPFQMPGQPPPRPKPAWLAFQELREDYEVRNIETSAESIDDDVTALILIHPKDLSDRTLFAIDQFVMRGGHLLAFIDPISIADRETSIMPQPDPYGLKSKPSELDKLLGAWGIQCDTKKVLVDQNAITRLGGANNQVEESPVVLTLDGENINRDDLVTKRLEMLIMPFCAVFQDQTSDDIQVTPLITSSEASCLVDRMSAQFGQEAMRSQMKRSGVSYNIAVRLDGKFKSAFPKGRPAAESEDAEKQDIAPPTPGIKEGESVVVLVGDADLFYDRFCVRQLNFFGTVAHQPINDNLNLFANIVEQIVGSSDLIGIRSRGKFSRPFEKVIELEENAGLVWKEKENDLVERLRDTQNQLREMERTKDDAQGAILSDEQQAAIEKFRKDELRIKKELKEVRKKLRKDIERLGTIVKVTNIGLMPLVIALTGVVFGVYRRRRKS